MSREVQIEAICEALHASVLGPRRLQDFSLALKGVTSSHIGAVMIRHVAIHNRQHEQQ
jgi:hypothetical protein